MKISGYRRFSVVNLFYFRTYSHSTLTINKRETWEIFIEILPLYLVLIYLYPDAYHSNIWEFVISYLVIL